MKKLCLLLLTVFLFSCSKNDEILRVESQDEADAATLLFNATGSANKKYGKAGPYKVSTNAVQGDCRQLLGIAQRILGKFKLINPEIRCSSSFPYGFEQRLLTEVSYPTNISSLEKLPVISFVGGLLSNHGNYDALVKLWVSYGFVVVNSNNFGNFSPSVHLHGLHEIVRLNNDPASPLYNKVDFSRTLLSGHSAGGSGAMEISKLPDGALSEIHADLKLIGSFPLEASFAASGVGVNVPTLILTGSLDIAVPPYSFPLTNQFYRITNAPAWYACASKADHGSPILELKRNEFAGISVAFILYKAKNDAAAAKYFVGSKYELTKDSQFVQDKSLAQKAILLTKRQNIAVQRNALASRL
ncbi:MULTISPECIES: poly(ethylene terephthalate) hydrolase family protein [Sphingobacterium]|uniref:Alpha/beta hydrolase n=1 Tax=Sphingobacterium populi TaxID=1812824 RepID=A0ABW5UBH4_9SPHI|nr:alpha/beta hydrolase [Sphingobacterium sp. CFCC 11742]